MALTLNPSSPAPLPAADLLRILEEKDHLLADQEVRLSNQEAELAKQQALLKERETLNAELRKHILLLEEQLRLARLRKFGARSEKLPFQGELFDEAELEVALEAVEKELAEAEEPKKPRKRHTKADGFDENLPRTLPAMESEAKAGSPQ
ncbi:transposase domain-containing protein [Thiolapillus sp.]|uniref:transposase domain-containing protein n=1 Tax=Thiolapillus sp. TaxID=2017437 RepID=UPI003AF87B60